MVSRNTEHFCPPKIRKCALPRNGRQNQPLFSSRPRWLPLFSFLRFSSPFLSPSPSCWSHAHPPTSIPVELVAARPPVASGGAEARAVRRSAHTSGSILAMKRHFSQPPCAMDPRPNAQQREHGPLEPTHWPTFVSFTSAACGTEENSSPQGTRSWRYASLTQTPGNCLSLSPQ